MSENLTQTANQNEIKCKSCNAALIFKPGTTMLGCDSCGAENEITLSNTTIEELDFEKFVKEFLNNKTNTVTVSVVTCGTCKAQTEFKPNIVADHCDFCGSPIAVKDGSACTLIKPKSLLPFAIDEKKSFTLFRDWLGGLWWAPNDLKKYASSQDKLVGMYIPYWTYDSDTTSNYSGRRGDNYTDTETYTTFENGHTVTKTRTVTKIRWWPASGTVHNNFDDILVLASNSLPASYTNALEPWDLESLLPYDEKFLSGFKAETYQVSLTEGFDKAKTIMDKDIRDSVKKDIGGDHQEIWSLNSKYDNITFKHILLPVWLSTFRYNGKPYRFMINARTGEVQGERPYSFWKIFLFIFMCLAIIGAAVWFFAMRD